MAKKKSKESTEQRKVLAADENSIFGVAVSDKTFEIKRGKNKFTIYGKDFSIVGTPSRGKKTTMVRVKDGALVEDEVEIATDEDFDDEGKFVPRHIKKDPEDEDDDDKKKKQKDDDAEDEEDESNDDDEDQEDDEDEDDE